ncbi:MAG: hypothetical protein WC370_09740 [Dehalococcoidales bacterium]
MAKPKLKSGVLSRRGGGKPAGYFPLPGRMHTVIPMLSGLPQPDIPYKSSG